MINRWRKTHFKKLGRIRMRSHFSWLIWCMVYIPPKDFSNNPISSHGCSETLPMVNNIMNHEIGGCGTPLTVRFIESV